MISTIVNKLSKKHTSISLGDKFPTRIMAAINLSSESFFKASYCSPFAKDALLKRFQQVLAEGCEFIDLGPKSTAPMNIYGENTEISPKEEIKRLTIPLQLLQKEFPHVLISIDTQSSEVADFSISHGADIINDISGLKKDRKMASVISDANASIILMACQNKPGDVFKTEDVIRALILSKEIALNAGISEKNLILDPGIGGWVAERSPKDDFRLIIETPVIKKALNLPALIALSRKSFIGKTLNIAPSERLAGSIAATSISTFYGADIIRTHDVIETKHAIIIAEELNKIVMQNN